MSTASSLFHSLTVTLVDASGGLVSETYHLRAYTRGVLASSPLVEVSYRSADDAELTGPIATSAGGATLYFNTTAKPNVQVFVFASSSDTTPVAGSGLTLALPTEAALQVQLDGVYTLERASVLAALVSQGVDDPTALLRTSVEGVLSYSPDLTAVAAVASLMGSDAAAIAAQASASALAEDLTPYVQAALGADTSLLSSLDEVLYGLIRQGMPATGALLLSQPVARLEDALNGAIAARQISEALSDSVSTFAKALRDALAYLAAEDGSAPLWQILGTTSLSDEEKIRFLLAWLGREGAGADFWSGLSGGDSPSFTAAQVAELQAAVGLGTLVGGDAALMGALVAEGVTAPSDLVGWTASEWETRLTTYLAAGYTLPIDGATTDDTGAEVQTSMDVGEYAAHLAKQVEAAFPSSRLKATMLARGTAVDGLADLLSDEAFDFESSRARDGLSATDDGALLSTVEAHQRMYAASPDDDRSEVVLRLTEAGYNSARRVAQLGRRAFAARHAETFTLDGDTDATSGATRARQSWSRGRAQSAQAQALHAVFSPDFVGARPAAVPALSTATLDGLDLGAAPAGQLRLKLDFQDVFASRRSTTRPGALSAFSPAAYLVDLLAWLKRCENSDGRSAYDVLIERRPDIPAVQLSEANTTRTLPAIDLVLETLEAAAGDGLATVAVATTGATEDLLAYPEHLNGGVYTALQSAVSPPHLPFHLWQEQGRVYLEALGVARHELMRQLQVSDSPNDSEIAAETLGLSPVAWQVITTPAKPREEALRWGYVEGDDTEGWTTTFSRARALMEALGVDYPTLRDMVGTDFVDPDGVATFTDDDHADGPLLTVADGDEATLAALLDRLQRFARLRTALPWSVVELDHAIVVADSPLGEDGLSDASLTYLAHLSRLAQTLDLPAPRLLRLWGALDIRPPRKDPALPSPHQEVYASRSIPSKTVNPLDVDPATGLLVEPVEEEGDVLPNDLIARATLGGNLDAIRAALNLSEAERLALIRDPDTNFSEETPPYRTLRPAAVGTSETRTLENLAQLHGLVTFSRALRLPLVELAALRNTFDASPVVGPESAWDFVDELRRLREAGVSVDELMYIVHCESYARDRVGVRVDDLSERLDALLSAVSQTREDWEALLAQTDANAGSGGTNLARLRLALELALSADDVEPLIALLGQETLSADDEASIRELLTDLVTNSTLNDLDDEAPEGRYLLITEDMLPLLLRDRCERVAIERVADLLGLSYEQTEALVDEDGELLNTLLDDALYAEEPDAVALTPLLADAAGRLLRLHRYTLLANRLKLDREALGWLLDHGDTFGLLGLTDLETSEARLTDDAGRAAGQARYAAWRNTVDLLGLDRALPGSEPAGVDLLTALVEDVEALRPAPEAFFDALHDRTGWSTEVMTGLGTSLGMTSSANFADVGQLMVWLDALRTTQRLGVTAEQAVALAAGELDESAALLAVQTVRARLGEAGWRQVGRPLRDRLRTRQRDALVAWTLNQSGLDRPEDLSKQLLVDVQVGPEVLTSRLVAATSAVQAFVLRSLLSLEPEVQLSREESEQWEWMSRYRMWEANRKVFFYPENWLEPELRDDKSELFETLESELLQGELSDVMVERVFERFLEGLASISNLLVLGHVHEQEDDEDGTVDILHVFGRTRSNPPTYYYRQCVDQSRWTPWEKLDIGIEGDHLIPVVFNRRLTLYWATFVGQAEEEGKPRWWDIHFSYAERREGRWSAKVMLEKTLSTYAAEGNYSSGDLDEGSADVEQNWPLKDRKRSYTFRSWLSGDDLIIGCFYRNLAAYKGSEDTSGCVEGAEVGRLVFAPGRIRPEVTHKGKRLWPLYPAGTISRANLYAASDETMSSIKGLYLSTTLTVDEDDPEAGATYGTEQAVQVLGAVSAPFSITPPTSERLFQGQVPFFFHDKHRTYFVVPESMSSARELQNSLTTGALNLGRLTNFSPTQVKVASLETVHAQLLQTYETAMLSAVESVEIKGLTSAYLPTLATKLETTTATMTTAAFKSTISTSYVGSFTTELSAATTARTAMISTTPSTSTSTAASFVATTAVAEASTTLQILAPVAELASQILAGPSLTLTDSFVRLDSDYKYRFEAFSHPYAWRLLRTLRREGVFGVLRPDEDGQDSDLCRQQLANEDYFDDTYKPVADRVVTPTPTDEIDFSATGAYSAYNWELFFHAPLLIAERLRRDQKFAEARQWFHCIFDPTDRSSGDSADTSRFWKVKPLFESSHSGMDTLLDLYSDDPGTVAQTQRQLDAQLDVWRDDPFDPHAIARLRVAAYQKSVVMKYLDNVIDWADHLFQQDTLESVNEATTLYLLAAELLGDRPILAADEEPETEPPTVQDVLDELDDADGTFALSDPLIRAENLLPRTLRPANLREKVGLPLSALPTALHVPHNEHLLSYWAKVEDRLFKIRHSQNIEGMTRTLPLFAPPIDPALLVRARAMGVDLSAAIAELEAPLPPYKFPSMLQQAFSLAGTVRALGGALQAALEKRDSEALSLLRGGQEQALLKALRAVKEKAIEEAEQSLAGVNASYASTKARKNHFESLIKTGLIDSEKAQLRFAKASQVVSLTAGAVYTARAIAAAVAQFSVGTCTGTEVGGQQVAAVLESIGQGISTVAGGLSSTSSISGMNAGNKRRLQDWKFQRKAAQLELAQLEKMILAAEIRKSIAERDLKNHDLQMEHAESVDAFMRSKFTNQQLYDWTVTQLSGLYFQSYRLAVDTARKAERCFRHELGQSGAAYIQYGHWDSLRKGLLAGDRLQLDLDRMSAAFTEQHRRENEITKHISLALLDASALQQLRLSGACDIELPEALFDQDFPGHYFRRIRTVSVTIPCVAGPFGGINATLTLNSSRVRTSTDTTAGYAEEGTGQDSRFQHLYGAQSVALSSGQNDGGVFELSLQDPRYLPFEGAGAVSTWRLELEGAAPLFDWQSISDVVMHLRYTSRSSATLKAEAIASVKSLWADAAAEGLVLGLSARADFSDAWYRFLNPAADATEAKLEMAVAQVRFPRPLQGAALSIYKVELIQVTPSGEEVAGLVSTLIYATTDLGAPSWDSSVYGAPAATLTPATALDVGDTLTLTAATGLASDDTLTDLVVLVHYTAEFSG